VTTDRFADRAEAGRRLGEAVAQRLAQRLTPRPAPRQPLVVLGLPRGGLVVAAEVARRLAAPLDVLVVRKLGVPGRAELAMGAVAAGTRVLNHDLLRDLAISSATVAAVTAEESRTATRQEQDYRGLRPAVALEGTVAVVVDDGAATGATAAAALRGLRHRPVDRPASVLLAVPVSAPDTLARLGPLADDVVCLHAPVRFTSVGEWYLDFRQVDDDAVRALLRAAAAASQPSRSPPP
jgi:putative phosphoribosyl transferase